MSGVLVRFALDSKRTQWITVAVPEEEAQAQGLELAARASGQLVQDASETFDSATSVVVPVAESILTRLKSIGERPGRIEVEFGVSLSFQAGAVIASSAAAGNFTVRLTWTSSDE